MFENAENALRTEFNQWAAAGRGDSMEQGHAPVGVQAIAQMGLLSDSTVLDLGCGNGWACRAMAQTVTAGEVVGIDVSDEMIRHSQGASKSFSNIRYVVSGASKLPFEDSRFSGAFSMESIYYYPEPLLAIREVHRVLKPGGVFCAVVDLFKENEPTGYWIDKLNVPVHFLGREDYQELFESAGFENVVTELLADPSPISADISNAWFKSREDYLRYREVGSLLIKGYRGHA